MVGGDGGGERSAGGGREEGLTGGKKLVTTSTLSGLPSLTSVPVNCDCLQVSLTVTKDRTAHRRRHMPKFSAPWDP